MTEDLKRDKKRKVELEKKVEEATGDQDNFRSHIDDHNKGFYELKKKKDSLQTERNDLCRKEMNLQQSLSALKEELSKADQTLRSMAGKPILNGRDSVKKVVMIKVPEKFEDLPSTEDQRETGKIRMYTLQHYIRPKTSKK